MCAAVVYEGRGKWATVVDDGKGKRVYECRRGSRVGAGGCMCAAVVQGGKWAYMCG
jgi:hypothetical protein